MWRKLARGYPVLAGYNQTGQGQDRTVGRGGDKDMERLRAGGGMWGLGGRGGPGGLAFLLSQRGGGAGLAGFRCSLGPLPVSACLQHGEDVGPSPPAHACDLGSDRRDGPHTDR